MVESVKLCQCGHREYRLELYGWVSDLGHDPATKRCLACACLAFEPPCPECGESGMLHRAIHAIKMDDLVGAWGETFRVETSLPERLDGFVRKRAFMEIAHHARLALGMEGDR